MTHHADTLRRPRCARKRCDSAVLAGSRWCEPHLIERAADAFAAEMDPDVGHWAQASTRQED
jgi:hypothetical protein